MFESSSSPNPSLLPTWQRPSAIVGRQPELKSLNAALEDLVTEGRGGLVLITGEAGIGKTRLGAELRTQALARGCQWLEGRYDKEGSIPLKPYAEAERTYLSTQPEIPLRDLAGSYSAEMARAFPALALDLVSATQESGRNVPFVLQHR
jgi:predicted ATPase